MIWPQMSDKHVALEAPANDPFSQRDSRPSPRLSLAPSASKAIGSADRVVELEGELVQWKRKAIELDKSVFEMRALLQSGKGFSEILKSDSLLAAFMAVCRERYGAVNSTVLLLDDLDPENIFYRVRAFHGLPSTYAGADGTEEELLLFRLPHDQGLLWQLIHQGDVFSVLDMQRMPRFKTAFRHWDLNVLRSDVWIPLMRGGDVLGILTLGECEDGAQIAENEYTFLQEIAAVAATNIDSTLKYEKNKRILDNLRTLYDVNQHLANVNDFKKLTIETLSTAVDALRAQKANLMLYNVETGQLEIKVVWGNIPRAIRDEINNGQRETKSFKLGEGVAGKAAATRAPVRINDRTRIEQVGKQIAYCMLSVPLIYGDNMVGVMTLTNKVKDDKGEIALDPLGRFGADDEQLLLGLADQASANLHKARLYNASITDRMTGLFNTRHFETSFEEFLTRAEAEGKPLSLAVTDIDHFKKFNDTHGHKAGDEVLIKTAMLLADMVREGTLDAAFRYGGEEFCMLLPDTDARIAAGVIEEYRQRIEAMDVHYEDKVLKVTVSAGIAESGEHLETRKAIFEAADKALYASKDGGRNQVTYCAPDDGAHTKV